LESLVNIDEVKYSQILVSFLSMDDEKLFMKTKAHFLKEKFPTTIKEIKTVDGLVYKNNIN